MSGSHPSSPTRHYGAQAVNTTATSTANEFNGGATHTVTLQTPVVDGNLYITAPCDGSIESIKVVSVEAATTAEVKALSVTNLSATPTAAIAAMQTLALAAMTPGNVTLSTTAGKRDVNQGDNIKIVWDIDGITTDSLGALTAKFIEGFKEVPT